jgi:hypothetical protein
VLSRRWCLSLGAAAAAILMILNWTSDPGWLDVRDIVTVYLIVQLGVWWVAVAIGRRLWQRHHGAAAR